MLFDFADTKFGTNFYMRTTTQQIHLAQRLICNFKHEGTWCTSLKIVGIDYGVKTKGSGTDD